MRIHRTAIAIIALAQARAHADVPLDVTALFEQGVKDMRAGNTAVACKEIAAALAKYQDSGIQGTLAECYTKLGKVASAWNLWKELADTAPADLRPVAAQNAAKLEARLPHFKIDVRASVPGLAVTVNDDPITDPTLQTPLPIDPGPLKATARAPGYVDWSATLEATEGTLTTIEIPKLVEVPKSPDVVTPPAPTPPPPAAPTEAPDPGHGRHVLALTIGSAGVVALGVGLAYGVSASSTWSDSMADCHQQGSKLVCDQKGFGLVQDTISNGNVATVLLGLGVAAVGTGVALWLTAPTAEHPQAITLVPQLGPSLVGGVVTGRF